MAFITSGSEPSILTESQLFYIPPTITERIATYDSLIGPSAATFDDANDITFDIAPSTDLISLADIRFQCDLHILKADGTSLDPAANVCPCNNIMSTLFQNVTIELAGRSISDTSNLYFMRAYMENVLGYTQGSMRSQLSCEGFYHDSTQDHTNWMGTFTAAVGTAPAVSTWLNADQVARQALMNGTKPLQLSGKIHCDLFQQDKPLIPGVSLTIKFVRARPGIGFTALNAGGIPKAAIRNPKLCVRKYEPAVSYMNALSKRLLTAPAVYHFERVQMRQMTINTGQIFSEWPNMVTGQLPKMMMIAMISSKSLSGTHDTNPFYLNHFKIQHLAAEIDGKIYPSNGYDMDFTTNNSLRAYGGLCRSLEVFNEATRELSFTRTEYNEGFTIFGFDFTPSGTSRGALTLIKQGNLNLNMRFKEALTEPIVVIAYLVFDATISINNQRQAIFDFTP